MIDQDQPGQFFTIGKTYGPVEIKVKGSRFIAYLYPVANAEEADLIITGLRKKYHDATHVCFAYRLGSGKEEYSRYSDDGEPGGTAGLPIYHEIKNKGYWQVLAAVIRYFGGIKLGTGGLVRAYAEAAREVTRVSQSLTIYVKKEVTLDFPYPFTGEVMQVVHRFSLEVIKQEYTPGGTSMKLAIPIAKMDEVAAALTHISSGKLRFR